MFCLAGLDLHQENLCVECALAGEASLFLRHGSRICIFWFMVYYSNPWRARRSVLFMPASNSRAITKAESLDCDGVIFDLEDSVSANDQEQARKNLLELVCGTDFGGKEKVIRVSSPHRIEYSQDVSIAIECCPDVILLPKVESAEPLRNLNHMLDYCEAGGIKIWAMIETPRALLNLSEIAAFGANLDCLVVGSNDLACETGVKIEAGRDVMVPWLMDIVAHGRANGLAVLDGVFNNFDDLEGLKLECEQGARMGFDGKTLIHPKQITSANQAFSPSKAEISRAQAIVDLFSDPQNKDKGALQLDGEMVEELHFINAQNLLALVQELEMRI